MQNSLAFIKACDDLFWNHRLLTPHRSETNSITARATKSRWADATECHCFWCNIQDLLAEEKPRYERIFCEHFAVLVVQCVAKLKNIPSDRPEIPLTRAPFHAAHARTPDVITRLAQGLHDLFVCLKSHFIIGHVSVEHSFDPFPPNFSSPTASLTPPTASPTPLTGIGVNPCATPLWGGPSGHLADPIPDTGCELKFCIDVSSEHCRSTFRPET